MEHDFQRAGPNKRVCAFLIDFAILYFFAGLIHLLNPNTKNELVYVFLFVVFLFKDMFGQSLGKYIIGIAVRASSSRKMSWLKSPIRNFTFFCLWPLGTFVPMAPPSVQNIWPLVVMLPFFVEYILGTRSKNQKRAGDLIAGTEVYDLRPELLDKKFGKWSLAIFLIFVFGLLWYQGYAMKKQQSYLKQHADQIQMERQN